MVPSVVLTKLDGNVGVLPTATDGVCAVIAPATSGTANLATSVASTKGITDAFGSTGLLPQALAWMLNVARKPVVGVRCNANTVGAYSSVTKTGTGTSVFTAGAAVPDDDYRCIVTFVAGGTVGVAGITYTFSLDNGRNTSPVLSLGVANTISLGGGVSLNLGAGTIVAGDKATFTTTAPIPNSTNLTDALEALRVTGVQFESILVANYLTPTEAAVVETWNLARQSDGKFRVYFMNARKRDQVTPETRAAYLAAMQALWSPFQSVDGSVGYDAAEVVSPINGLRLVRPVSWVAAARTMGLADISTDPAYMNLGSLPNTFIADDNLVPQYHDEAQYPGADGSAFTTLRSALVDGIQGVYPNNVRTFKLGSDYRWIQQARVINKAASIAFNELTRQLSLGVDTNPPGSQNAGHIAEPAAQGLEGLVNAQLESAIVQPKLASYAKLSLSRADNILASDTLTGQVQVQFKGYAKTFNITIAARNPVTQSAGT